MMKNFYMPSNNNSALQCSFSTVHCSGGQKQKAQLNINISPLSDVFSHDSLGSIFKEFFDVINLFRDLLRVMKLVNSSETVHRFVSIDLLVVSSTFQIVHSHFDLVSWLLALEATEPVSEPISKPVTPMAVELINNHLSSVQQKRCV